jgi:hypothetical protein
MVVPRWYEIYTEENGNPIAYVKGKTKAKLYKNNFNLLIYNNLGPSTENLEYRLTKQDVPEGYFKYKSHAEKFNQEILKGKGIISPNRRHSKLLK